MAGAVFLLAILGLIVAQMVARRTGNVFPGGTNYAGYAMAGASFLALAYALNKRAVYADDMEEIGSRCRVWI